MHDLQGQLMIRLLFHMGLKLCMAITIFLLYGKDKGPVKLIYKLSVFSEVRPAFHMSGLLLIIRPMMTNHLYMLIAPAFTSVNLQNIFRS